MMKKLDIISGSITGLITGIIAWRVLVFIGKPDIFGIPVYLFIIIVPVLWITGVWLGYFLGRKMPFFSQFGKYVAIGFTNFSVDAGVVYFLIAITGRDAGLSYTVFKVASFCVAVSNSYLWNKFWAFNAASSGGGGSEAMRFLSVNLVAMVVNVGIASLVVNVIGPMGGFTTTAWAGIGSVIGSASALIFSFLGFRLIVFKKVLPEGTPTTP